MCVPSFTPLYLTFVPAHLQRAFTSLVFLFTLSASLSRGYFVCIAVFHFLLTSCIHTAISIHRHLLIWLACRSLRATGCHGFCKPYCLSRIYRKLYYHSQSHIGIVYSFLMAKPYLFQRTNKNTRHPLCSSFSFFVNCQNLHSYIGRLYKRLKPHYSQTSTLAQLAVGSRAQSRNSFRYTAFFLSFSIAGSRLFSLIK